MIFCVVVLICGGMLSVQDTSGLPLAGEESSNSGGSGSGLEASKAGQALAILSTPALSPEDSLQNYLRAIRKFPMLSADEEYMLAKRWREHDDQEAAHRLVTSHLRLVAKIAMGYRGYGLPVAELISEGNVGMMQAVKRYDPDRGFRLATYAMWWIKASIHEYVLHSWSLVKMGTTAAQKKLFFNLRKIKARLNLLNDTELAPEDVSHIAESLCVSEDEVISMNRRLGAGDHSLNTQIRGDGETRMEWQDMLADEAPTHAEQFEHDEELDVRRQLLEAAMAKLTKRERRIVQMRRLVDEPMTLEQLSVEFDVTRERVRQIENRAMEKLQKSMVQAAAQFLPHAAAGAEASDAGATEATGTPAATGESPTSSA